MSQAVPVHTIEQDIEHTRGATPLAESGAIVGELKDKIDAHLAKYPSDQRKSAIMPALTLAQNANNGYLTNPLMNQIAHYLGVSPMEVYEVATFYSMYEHAPVGQFKICVCKNISCMLRGSDELLAHMQKVLGVGLNEVTADGRFSIKEVECLGACGGAPALYINNDYYEHVDAAAFDALIKELK
jgi:NADH-quinone oxidoreductase subunit E